MAVQRPDQVIEIPIKNLIRPKWNPNQQDTKTFNALCEQIQEAGILEYPVVVPAPDRENDGEPMYRVMSGNHRVEAMEVLGEKTCPCAVKQGWDEDMQKFQNVRFNVLKGNLNPDKFAKLYREMEAKYSKEAVKDMMKFTDEKKFEKLVGKVKESLPKEMRKQVEDVEDDVNDLENLSLILNKMFRKYGKSLDFNFMIFEYGGKNHHWFRMNAQTKALIEKVEDYCSRNEVDINNVFGDVFAGSDYVKPKKKKRAKKSEKSGENDEKSEKSSKK